MVESIPLHILPDIEREHDISIIDARAFGSRAWNLDSPESDTDIAAIFIHQNPAKYLHLRDPITNIDADYPEYDIEVEGWDITRFTELLHQSNTSMLEYLNSSVVYRSGVDITPLKEHANSVFNPMAVYHNYRSLAEDNYRKYISWHLVDQDKDAYPIIDEHSTEYVVETPNGDTTTIPKRDVKAVDQQGDGFEFEETMTRQTVKRNLIIARAVLYARFIRESVHEYGTHRFPMMDFPAFIEEQAPLIVDEDILAEVRDLIALKKNAEGGQVVGDVFGSEFVHVPIDIDSEIHATPGISGAELNQFIDTAFSAGVSLGGQSLE